jgi:methylmalonyl-CoA/ethylmalonyl-CoA epimerase
MKGILEGLVIGIDHVAICVGDMDGGVNLWTQLLGLPMAHREKVEAQKTEASFVDDPAGVGKGASIEIIAPMAGNAGLEKFLEKRGQGLHHLAVAVTDIKEALRRLDAAGVPLIDKEPRPGARGHVVAFLHPKATNGTLVELVERHDGGAHAHSPSSHSQQSTTQHGGK